MSDVGGRGTLPCDLSHDAYDLPNPSLLWTDRRLRKHYLPATSFADGNKVICLEAGLCELLVRMVGAARIVSTSSAAVTKCSFVSLRIRIEHFLVTMATPITMMLESVSPRCWPQSGGVRGSSTGMERIFLYFSLSVLFCVLSTNGSSLTSVFFGNIAFAFVLFWIDLIRFVLTLVYMVTIRFKCLAH